MQKYDNSELGIFNDILGMSKCPKMTEMLKNVKGEAEMSIHPWKCVTDKVLIVVIALWSLGLGVHSIKFMSICRSFH